MPVTTTDQTPTPAQPGDGEHVGALRARQGFKDRPILWILLISMTLVVIAFGLAFVTNWSPEGSREQGAGGIDDPAVAATFDAPEPAPKVVQSN